MDRLTAELERLRTAALALGTAAPKNHSDATGEYYCFYCGAREVWLAVERVYRLEHESDCRWQVLQRELGQGRRGGG